MTDSEQTVDIYLDTLEDGSGVVLASAFFKGPRDGCDVYGYTVMCVRQSFEPPATTGMLTISAEGTWNDRMQMQGCQAR